MGKSSHWFISSYESSKIQTTKGVVSTTFWLPSYLFMLPLWLLLAILFADRCMMYIYMHVFLLIKISTKVFQCVEICYIQCFNHSHRSHPGPELFLTLISFSLSSRCKWTKISNILNWSFRLSQVEGLIDITVPNWHCYDSYITQGIG